LLILSILLKLRMLALLVSSICWCEIWHYLRTAIGNSAMLLFWNNDRCNIRSLYASSTHRRWHTFLYVINCISLRIVIHLVLNFIHWQLIFIVKNNLCLYRLLLRSDFQILHKHPTWGCLLLLPHHGIILYHIQFLITFHTCTF